MIKHTFSFHFDSCNYKM